MARPELIKEEKPMSEATKRKLNEAAKMLSVWLEKRELQIRFKCTERSARDMISAIAKRVPVISTSDNKGYKRALTVEDLSLAKQACAEIDSRIRELFARKKPLNDFILKFEKGEDDGSL